MQTTRPVAALLVAAGAFACGAEPEPPGPDATACAALVSFQRGVSVELTRHASKPGRVRIDYRSGDEDGVALCEVRGRPDGTFEILGALVDENRLRDDELAAFAAVDAGSHAGLVEED